MDQEHTYYAGVQSRKIEDVELRQCVYKQRFMNMVP
jgi:hypothetical protein